MFTDRKWGGICRGSAAPRKGEILVFIILIWFHLWNKKIKPHVSEFDRYVSAAILQRCSAEMFKLIAANVI